MTDVAAETAQAFLTAMDTEEPFQLLRTLPGKLEELWAIEVQSASVDVCDATPHIFHSFDLRLETPSGGNITQPVESL